MAAQIFSCPECDHKLRSNNPIAPGKKVRCPRCQAVFAVPAAPVANSVATGIKKAAMTKPTRSRDDDEDDAPVRKRREEVIAPPRRSKPIPRAEDLDDEDDEEEEERPRKKKKKKQSSSMPLILGLSGAGALLIIFVVTAFLWPGFLVGGSDSKGPQGPGGPRADAQPGGQAAAEGPDNVLAYVPADSAVLAGANVSTLRTLPTFPKDMQQLRTVFAMQGLPPEIADLMNDLDRVVVGVSGNERPHFVAALSTTGAYDEQNIQKVFQTGPGQTIAGRTAYRLKSDPSSLVAMPSKRVVVVTNLPEQGLEAILNTRQVTLDNEVQQQVSKVQSSMMWALALNRGAIQQGLQGLNPANMRGLPPGADKLIPYLQRAKSAFATIDMPGGKSLVMKAGLSCADAKDAQAAGAQLQTLWTQQGKGMLGGARFMFAAPEMEPLVELLNDVERSFKIAQQGSEVTATVQISEKTIAGLEGMQRLLPGAGFNPGIGPGAPKGPMPPRGPGTKAPRQPPVGKAPTAQDKARQIYNQLALGMKFDDVTPLVGQGKRVLPKDKLARDPENDRLIGKNIRTAGISLLYRWDFGGSTLVLGFSAEDTLVFKAVIYSENGQERMEHAAAQTGR
jgi:hypothetical protein